MHFSKGRFDLAIINYKDGLVFAENLSLSSDKASSQAGKKIKANLLGGIGNVYIYQSNYPKALEYFLNALKLSEEIEDKDEIGRHNTNLGNVYYLQENYPKALDFYSKALKLKEELGQKRSICVNLGSIGNVYNQERNFTKSSEYYLKALKMAEE